jgi:Kdo2-lipid IVA lauroyltransferase/acyltransferase
MLVILFRLLSLLPLRMLHALGAALGWLVYAASPTYRNRLKDNIGQAGLSNSLRAAIGEAGKSVMELPFIWCAAPERVLKTITMKNWEVVQEALDANHGILFLTPHLGCFEIIPQFIATKKPVTVMYRPPHKKALLPLVEGARARKDLLLAPANLSGVRMMLKALKRGGLAGLLPDQVPQQGEGVWADFFGKPAYTMTLPAKLQQMTGAPIVLTYAERLPRGRGYAIHFVRFDADLDGTPERQARVISAGMERLIADCPSQYFWSYNRYKKPDGVEAPPVRE